MNIEEVLYLPVKREGLSKGPDEFDCKHRYRTLDGDEVASSFKAKSKEELLDQPKPVVPQCAIDYYEQYKELLSDFEEWFGDFYDSYFLKEFPKGIELAEWLHDNDNKTNLQHELALATLIVNGPDAVTVEKEKLYTVEIPNPNIIGNEHTVLMKNGFGQIVMFRVYGDDWRTDKGYQNTESEIRKYFDWAWREGFQKEVTDD
ncbi:TPA: DUF1642 domain-containing protein [Streptococcus pyogenes]|uniref:DUF1642 domain-containing protein n=1 Tax=Streptococcus pyogenes TaxID=1314 RepID=UPI002B153421|nr:DUF1642 domain-containing protein [Streptococcus pyogenes]HEQ3723062.1 DUF1642 domain-containing protein [Streptococcus pyogenes]HEQ3738218.1 DUF1642 domain-containing protein [Streptococcus pyogenes]HEQ4054375.1 DUF1642 domain-containing protein [Streptococcus pyogenes]HEQ4130984.1 DUF1642 domain-containing protein [Streptococcus pyogenes]